MEQNKETSSNTWINWREETSVVTSGIAKEQANKVKNWSAPWKYKLYGFGFQIYLWLFQSNIVAKISKRLAHFRLSISDHESETKRNNTQQFPPDR